MAKSKKEREFASCGSWGDEDPSYETHLQNSKGLNAAHVDPKDRRKALKLAKKLGLQRRTK